MSALFGPLFFFPAALFPQEILCRTKKAPPLLASLYWSAQMEAPKNWNGKILEDSSWIFCHGFKLNFGALEARLFNSCPKTGGADFWALDGFEAYEKIFDRRRWSLSFDLSKIQSQAKCRLSIGSIKVYSKKRMAPFSTAVSPFAPSVSDAGVLAESLPSKSSSPQTDALYFSAEIPPPGASAFQSVRLLPFRTDFSMAKRGGLKQSCPFWISLGGGFLASNYFSLTSGVIFGRYLSEETFMADFGWMEDVPAKSDSLNNCFAADISIEIPHLKCKTTLGAAQNSQSLGRTTFAQELLFSVGNFSLAAAFFASDNLFMEEKSPYAAANGKEYKKNWQAKISPQFSRKLKSGRRLKAGTCFFAEEQIKDYEKSGQRRSVEGKAAAGISVSSKTDSIKFTAGLGPACLKEIPSQKKAPPPAKISANFYCSHSFLGQRGGRLAISGGASFQPDQDEKKREWTERLKISFYPKKSVLSSVSIGASASQKNNKFKFSPSASAAFLLKFKAVSVNASVQFLASFGQ